MTNDEIEKRFFFDLKMGNFKSTVKDYKKYSFFAYNFTRPEEQYPRISRNFLSFALRLSDRERYGFFTNISKTIVDKSFYYNPYSFYLIDYIDDDRFIKGHWRITASTNGIKVVQSMNAKENGYEYLNWIPSYFREYCS